MIIPLLLILAIVALCAALVFAGYALSASSSIALYSILRVAEYLLLMAFGGALILAAYIATR